MSAAYCVCGHTSLVHRRPRRLRALLWQQRWSPWPCDAFFYRPNGGPTQCTCRGFRRVRLASTPGEKK